jgi:eukaryotic-like serine/threonine-protein kinase
MRCDIHPHLFFELKVEMMPNGPANPGDAEKSVSASQTASGSSKSTRNDEAQPETTILYPDPLASNNPTAMCGAKSSSADLENGANRWIGDYELLEEIGRGGMGVVYKAHQKKLNRFVALKMILAGQLAGPMELKRFQAEAEAAAKLDHPGIVPIFEIGEYAGTHYLALAFIEGPSLADRLAEGPLPAREAAELLKQLAEAVQQAHLAGVIHRDLKPANILLDAEGRPKITDFGLARQVDSQYSLTATGQILGTPSYMPPEQALGETNRIGPQSDVYSLGAVLYCLLVGRPPFLAATPLETLRQVIDQEPLPPRVLNPNVPREMEAICMQCLEKSPDRRYRSAGDLAEDMRRFLEGEPISVRSVNLLDRLARSLTHSRDDQELKAWGSVLLWFAPLVFLAEVGIFLHALGGPPYPFQWGTAIRIVQFSLMALVLWKYRHDWAGSLRSAGRQMGTIWLGFLIACHVVVGATFELQWLQSHREHFEVLEIYPYLAAVSGLSLFITGSNYWGAGYMFGLAFFGLALLMPFWPLAAPLEFGLLWGTALLVIGLRLKQLDRDYLQKVLEE